MGRSRRDCLIERKEFPIALKTKKTTVKMEDTPPVAIDENTEHTSSSLISLSDFSGHHGTLHSNGE